MKVQRALWLVLVVGLCVCAAPLAAQDKPKSRPSGQSEAGAAAEKRAAARKELFKKFEETLSNVKLVGHFTMGKEAAAERGEEYVISSVKKKAEKGNVWVFNTRLKYGKVDAPLPALELQVKWAGDTPVITLDDYTIPALGTFSARVLIHDDMYVGTWQHGKVGGQMFGRLVKIEEEKSDQAKPEK